MNDIQNQVDLHLLVGEFYKKLLSDDSISYVFTDVVKVKIEEHLPILVIFWSQVILETGGYYNNLTKIHLDINAKEYLSPKLFEIWLTHFNTSVDENFNGVKAQEIKKQASLIGGILQTKITPQIKKNTLYSN